ncbi:hypothetical protein ACHAWF_015131, partial [Thalassiosira exigua]
MSRGRRRRVGLSLAVALFATCAYFRPLREARPHPLTPVAARRSRTDDGDDDAPVPGPPRDGGVLRVASWNLRVPFPPDVERNLSWADRRGSLASTIAKVRPHVLAVQEDCRFMSDDLMDIDLAGGGGKLSDVYDRYGLFNRNGESEPTERWPENAFSTIVGRDGEHNSVWYDRRRFRAARNVTFWLSRDPEAAGSSFDEVTGRVVNCVLLQDARSQCARGEGASRAGCVDVFFCSTHLPAGNQTRQLWSVDVLSRMFVRYRDELSNVGPGSERVPLMMIAGDFNVAPGSDVHGAMERAGFVDSRALSLERTPIEEYSPSARDWYGGGNTLIDYVWIYVGVEGQLELPHEVISVRHAPVPCCGSLPGVDHAYNRSASDHLLVIADLTPCVVHYI